MISTVGADLHRSQHILARAMSVLVSTVSLYYIDYILFNVWTSACFVLLWWYLKYQYFKIKRPRWCRIYSSLSTKLYSQHYLSIWPCVLVIDSMFIFSPKFSYACIHIDVTITCVEFKFTCIVILPLRMRRGIFVKPLRVSLFVLLLFVCP